MRLLSGKMLAALACGIAAATGAFAELRSVSHDPWTTMGKGGQMRRHEAKLAEIAKGPAPKVVFIGDSITHFWETKGRNVAAKHFSQGDWKMLNLGTSGDRTEHVLWRLNEGRELEGYEAKCIVLMIGTNNTGHKKFSDEPPSDTILGIREILKTIRAKQPKAKVVLCAVFPRGKTPSDPYRMRNDVVNAGIRKFADGKNVFWCDLSDRFTDEKGNLPKSLFPDGLHPSAKGYEIWYEGVKPYIEYALSDGRGKPPAALEAKRPGAAAAKCAGKPKAARPEPRIEGVRSWWLDRLLRNRRQIAESGGEFDLAMLGDSITNGWEHKNRGIASWQALLKEFKILNLGYSADRTENLLWRLKNGELEGYKAKAIMLMIGTNNTWHRKDPPEHTAEGIRAILDTIAKKQPQAKTYLLPIFPFGDGPQHPNRMRNEKVNAIIKGFADGKRVIWLDFNSKFLDAKGDPVKYMDDRCHPNPAGYSEVWVPEVRRILQEMRAGAGK